MKTFRSFVWLVVGSAIFGVGLWMGTRAGSDRRLPEEPEDLGPPRLSDAVPAYPEDFEPPVQKAIPSCPEDSEPPPPSDAEPASSSDATASPPDEPAPTRERTGPETYAQKTGSFFAPAPADPKQSPRVTEIPIPEFPGGYAIWGATGRDTRGHIWFAVSAHREKIPSAHLFEYVPESGKVVDRGDAVSALKQNGVYRPGEGQMKIHSKIVQAGDGHLYFASMDEQGENEDGSRLPTWGSHLWRLRLPEHRWEHLHAAPEGLIAVSGVGRWIYALGYFGHVLYQYDTRTDTIRSVRVGSVGGHISRNLLADRNGHAYVPRLQKRQAGKRTSLEDTRGGNGAVLTTLVEFDTKLGEIAETRLEHYLEHDPQSSLGITGLVYIADGSMAFTTTNGYLFHIIPGQGKPAKVAPLGWFHPAGPAHSGSLFTFAGNRYLLGIAARQGQKHEWLVYDLQARESVALPLALQDLGRPGRKDLLLYGSVTRDDRGCFYVVGRYMHQGEKYPVLCRLSVEP